MKLLECKEHKTYLGVYDDTIEVFTVMYQNSSETDVAVIATRPSLDYGAYTPATKSWNSDYIYEQCVEIDTISSTDLLNFDKLALTSLLANKYPEVLV